MEKTIEISVRYSLSGSWIWTRAYGEKNKLHYGTTNFDKLEDRKKSLNKFVEKHLDFYKNKREVMKHYKVKKGWQFSFLIRDTDGMSLKSWHGFKITSKNFKVDYDKIAEKNNYDTEEDFGLFPWPHECR